MTDTTTKERKRWRAKLAKSQGYLDCFLSGDDLTRLLADADRCAALETVGTSVVMAGRELRTTMGTQTTDSESVSSHEENDDGQE